jgi:hypothetical protein
MPKKAIATSLLAVWLAFFGFELLGVSGLADASQANAAASVEAALAGLIQAEVSENSFGPASDRLPVGFDSPVLDSIALKFDPKAVDFVNDSGLYKLHLAFLL